MRFTEAEAWRKTPYQITTLFKIHKQFNPDRFKPDDAVDDIDTVFMGM